MFPSGFPVLCSSGRTALVLALQYAGLSRRDLITVFPYASHCVLDAVARITTPVGGGDTNNVPHNLVYHQWGYIQDFSSLPGLIEDCADCLCEPGTELFPSGGDYEIWSLVKILGTNSGGVLWCKSEERAEHARLLRDSRGGGRDVGLLRICGRFSPTLYAMWEGLETNRGRLSVFQCGELKRALGCWPDLGFTPFPRTVWLRVISEFLVVPFCVVFSGYGSVQCSR